MNNDAIKMRQAMQLLELGEKLNWPRMGIGPGKAIRSGKVEWERFCQRTPATRFAAPIRIAKVRYENAAFNPPPPVVEAVKEQPQEEDIVTAVADIFGAPPDLDPLPADAFQPLRLRKRRKQ